jgi:hypothetical protein
MTVRMPVANGDAKTRSTAGSTEPTAPRPLRRGRPSLRSREPTAGSQAGSPYQSDPRISPPEGVTAAHQVGEAMLYLMGMEVRLVSPFSSIE